MSWRKKFVRHNVPMFPQCTIQFWQRSKMLQQIYLQIFQIPKTWSEEEKMNFKDVVDVTVPPKFKTFFASRLQWWGYPSTSFLFRWCSSPNGTIEYFFGYGTFKVCTLPFYQLYTLHDDLGSTDESTNIVPLIYVLMSEKTEKSNTILFLLIEWSSNSRMATTNVQILLWKSNNERHLNCISKRYS